ncbi:MAG TPA: hypothetical protein VE986_05105 [Hyphomicrobiales bacterium]|nr:hypothetical protein [Hyphomicrobiales bacterium]
MRLSAPQSAEGAALTFQAERSGYRIVKPERDTVVKPPNMGV